MARYHVLSLVKDLGFTKSEINPVAIHDDDGLILFDAGYPDQIHDFEKALAAIGFTLSDIKTIVLSHHDHDHVGSLREMKNANPDLIVVASQVESAFISGEEKSLRLIQAQRYNEHLQGQDRLFGEQFARYLETIPTCPVDRHVDDNEYITPGVKVVFTPGHTPGHISLYLEEERVLLAGDALAIENDRLLLANPQFTLDMQEALRSVAKIQSMKPRKIVCYHGHSLDSSIFEELQRIIGQHETSDWRNDI